MAMAVDRGQQLPVSGLAYDQMRYSAAPQFTNPWASHQPGHMYQQPLPPVSTGFDDKVSRPGDLAYQLTPTAGAQPSPGNPYTNAPFDHPNSLDTSQGMMGQPRTYAPEYSIPATSQPAGFGAAPAPPFPGYQAGLADYHDQARPAYTNRAPQVGREGFQDALDASRNMVAMSQTDLTPRPIYGNDSVRQGAQDAYGFPTTHSAHSSISSASSYPYQYGSSVGGSVNGSIAGSVDGSVTDYSSAGEEVMGSRTLPRPTGYISGSLPPAASSMMSQFNSKVSPSTQKKHKCKICDKRFTRPSSLQTHMYSHTGEKPFACDVEGCGRHFSVVSNLRRHKKVHRGENDHPSPDDE